MSVVIINKRESIVKILLFMVPLLFMISCGDAFDTAEVSECIRESTVLTVGDGETQDIEMDDSDVETEESGEFVDAVIMISRTKEMLKFYLQTEFACEGFEYGYIVSVDPSDKTVLLCEVTAHDIWPDANVLCMCSKRMTIEYENEQEDLSKITGVKLFPGESYEKHLTFE